METYPVPRTGELLLLIAPRAATDEMLRLAAILALQGELCVLDGGNSFDAFQVARMLRRATPRLDEALNRIQVARSFTCYQMVAMLEETPDMATPHLVLDLLATFYDESVSLDESHRLLRIVIQELNRLRRLAPVAVSVRPPKTEQLDREGLLAPLKEIADTVGLQAPQLPPPPPTLFEL